MNSIFLSAIKESQKIAPHHGPTSTKRLYPIHKVIGEACENYLGSEFEINGLGMPDTDKYTVKVAGKTKSFKQITIDGSSVLFYKGNEKELSGELFRKKCDITCVSEYGLLSGTVLVKYPQSSYGKNFTNMKEHMLGETLNLREGGIIVGQAICLNREAPRLTNDGQNIGTDRVDANDVKFYLDLHRQDPDFHMGRPNALFMIIVELNQSGELVISDPNSLGLSDPADIITYNQLCNFDLFIKDFTKCLQLK